MNNELKNIKHTGFKVPKNYFSELEDQVLQNIKLDTALDNVENTGYKIPENYFDSLENTILDRVANNENTKVVTLFSKRNLIYISGIAAAALLFFSIFLNNTTTIDNIDIELVESYLLEEDINSYEIAALLEDEDLLEDIFSTNSILDESIEDYILENASIEDLLIE